MIGIDCQQGSDTWRQARLGIPTASQFDRLIKPVIGTPSARARIYLRELCVEWLLGYPADTASSQFMERGRALEPQAIAEYEFQYDVKVDRPGFIVRDDRATGCSPDGLVGDDGGIEIKCLSAANHIGALLDEVDPTEYRCQIQGCLWICERQWWDRVYYNPELPTKIVRIERDEAFIDALATVVAGFTEMLRAAHERLIAAGCVPRMLLENEAAEFDACVQAAMEYVA